MGSKLTKIYVFRIILINTRHGFEMNRKMAVRRKERKKERKNRERERESVCV